MYRYEIALKIQRQSSIYELLNFLTEFSKFRHFPTNPPLTEPKIPQSKLEIVKLFKFKFFLYHKQKIIIQNPCFFSRKIPKKCSKLKENFSGKHFSSPPKNFRIILYVPNKIQEFSFNREQCLYVDKIPSCSA